MGDRRKGPLPKYAPVQMFGKLTCEAVYPMSVWFPDYFNGKGGMSYIRQQVGGNMSFLRGGECPGGKCPFPALTASDIRNRIETRTG